MTEEDQRRGHRLAAAWLERSGERDPMVLAEHYRRGGELERAAIYLARAAHQALAASDLPGAMQRAAQGMACGAQGELLGTLRSIEAWAQIWLGDFQPAYEGMLAASELLPAGSAGWISIQGWPSCCRRSRASTRASASTSSGSIEPILCPGRRARSWSRR